MSQGSNDLTDAMNGSNTAKQLIESISEKKPDSKPSTDIDSEKKPDSKSSTDIDSQKRNVFNLQEFTPISAIDTQVFGTITSGEQPKLIEAQWYKANTVYQILEVRKPNKEKRKGKNIVTTIVAKERGNGSDNIQSENFNKYSLDQQTIDKLQDYPKKGDGSNISSYLPSSGVVFSKGFFDALSSFQFKKFEQNEIITKQIEQNEITNFYHPIRTLLYSRKISQLISKTWWSYLEAQKNELWDKFIAGEWEDIINYEKDINPNYGFDILDGLIAREIFLYGGAEPPDYPDPENSFYSPLKDYSEKRDQARFLILPSSRSWQGISLSLLLAGQAYYQRVDNNKYHQISQPIFSTGEITMLHSLEVDWGKFQGDIKEIIINHEKPWVGYHIVIPYPPIPYGADPDAIKKWAWAKEEPGMSDFPFYRKEEVKDGEKVEDAKYLMDVDYFKPPYPYIPLSCT
ncbi:hypothetical protein [Nostoc sp. DSM 114167]|jgi:hypothetical protein|uniref:hypothetical protein n=1 Tax=Nostoc sp. DSM 114167 TaxID=3439050 RepID=UPI00404630C3